MRVLLCLALALCLVAQLTQAQTNGGGILGTIRNFFNRPRRQNQFQPQQNQFQPQQNQFQQQNPFPPQQQPQPPQNFQPPFQPQVQSTRNQFNQRPQQQFQQQRPQFQQQRPQQQFQQQGNRFQPPNQSQNNNQFNSFVSKRHNPLTQLDNIPSSFNTCERVVSEANCPPPPRDHQYHFYNGKRYLLTWTIQCSNCECSKFTADEARDYCHSVGMRHVSLENSNKIDEFFKVSAQHALRYYWTGGRLQYPNLSIRWDNGVVQPLDVRTIGKHPWSHTGGWKLTEDESGEPDESKRPGRPQPDNRNQLRDNCEPETCIGVLNNFYADGIKFHDVACHHKKPTICEQ